MAALARAGADGAIVASALVDALGPDGRDVDRLAALVDPVARRNRPMTAQPGHQRRRASAPPDVAGSTCARRSDRATAVAVVAATVLALLIVVARTSDPPRAIRRSFAADARFARCGGAPPTSQYAFEIPQAADYRDVPAGDAAHTSSSSSRGRPWS